MVTHEVKQEGLKKVVLVITLPPKEREMLDDRVEEMTSLLKTAGCDVAAVCSQFNQKPVNSTHIGKGKIEEVRQQVEVTNAEEVVFDVELSPSQGRNLTNMLPVLIVDYPALILHIFSQNAKTHQAKLAVELAQLEYNKSRLKRLWSHLDRIKAGTNMRGPGEKQLETDKQLIRDRIKELKDRLKEIENRKERSIESRKSCVKIALVGYTNAGKSSVMNAVTDADVLAQDKLFATLDTRTTKLHLDTNHDLVLSDTVGFIKNLPHTLIASFHATLAEVREADLLLHVADVSQAALEEQIKSVESVLETIGADNIPTILVFNKIDKDHSEALLLAYKSHYKDSISISAVTGEGLDDLRKAILSFVTSQEKTIQVTFPIYDGAFDAFLRRKTKILHEEYTEAESKLTIEADDMLLSELEQNEKVSYKEVCITEDGEIEDSEEKFTFGF